MLQFFSAQGLMVAGNLLFGLLCVRLLAPKDYAEYVVVFAVQSTLLILMDANFSGTLIPIIGERVGNKQLIADYVASLRQVSIWAYIAVACGMVVIFPVFVRHRNWDATTVAGMVIVLLVSTWFNRLCAAYGPVLIVLGDRATWYRGQLVNSLGSLTLLCLFWWLGWLGPFQAMILNIAGVVYLASLCYFRANRLLGCPGIVSKEKRDAIFKLALPNMPQAFFFSVQGQLSLILITYFGHTNGVASVGALGRVGQIFAIFLQANGLLVEPYFAKLPKAALKKSYAIALLLAAGVSLSVTAIVISFPQMVLWVLGPQYRDLQFEVKLSVIAGGISCFSGVLWGIHSARRFVFWWNVMFSIGLTLVVQILFIIKVDIATVRGVLWLNIATNAASLLVNVLSGAYGFRYGPREVEKEAAPVTADEIGAEASLDMAPAQDGSTLHSQPRIIEPGVID